MKNAIFAGVWLIAGFAISLPWVESVKEEARRNVEHKTQAAFDRGRKYEVGPAIGMELRLNGKGCPQPVDEFGRQYDPDYYKQLLAGYYFADKIIESRYEEKK